MKNYFGRGLRSRAATLAAGICGLSLTAVAQVPFTIQGPGVDPAQFRVTTFATSPNFIMGMERLSDGSILAAVTARSGGFFSGTGSLVRYVDVDKDGVADVAAGATLATGISGGITSVRIGGNLVFVTGQKKPITILRLGATPGAAITLVGTINLTYPAGGWLHPHSALGLRPTPGSPNSYDLIFQLGSQVNFAVTPETATVSLSSAAISGSNGSLKGDSIYKLTITDNGTSVSASGLTQIANGLRNPAGFAFHPKTGDFYFEDNGIDGVVDANEPTSADELNTISLANFGGAVEFFGFPANYTQYRTGTFIGGQGVPPLVSFIPQPNPANGEETEGPNDIAFSPSGFPDALNKGVFVTFHGKFNLGGTSNEENAMAFVNLAENRYFHFIPSKLAGVGHLDGLLATSDSLFISDLGKTGNLNNNNNAINGVIYQVKALVGPSVHFQWVEGKVELTWAGGALERSTSLDGSNWSEVAANADAPYVIQASETSQFFRTRN